MSSIRVFAAGAALTLLSGLTAGGALAQTATDQTPGKPLQLLQWMHTTAQSSEPKVRPRAKIAERKIIHTATASAKHRRSPIETAEATPQATVWAPLDAVASDSTTIAATVEPAPQAALASANPIPNELVVAGQTVQIASPDQVNELDLGARDSAATASNATPADPASAFPATNNVTEAASKSDSLAAAPLQAYASQVGSTSWIAKVLAALGGAVAAGSAAWFLIGATPQRTYG
ncbi:MAG: hypothetical protein ACLPX7_07250 [Xanthobacteraceae bacterium]